LQEWGVEDTSEGALALLLAERVEDPGRAATVAPDAGRLLEVLAVCRGLAQRAETSPLDEIRAKRDAARDASAAG
jgi:hypothetical protein